MRIHISCINLFNDSVLEVQSIFKSDIFSSKSKERTYSPIWNESRKPVTKLN